MIKRIAIVTTSTSQPMLIQCIFKDDVLVMGTPENLPPSRIKQAITSYGKIRSLVERGFTVLVDERSRIISKATGAVTLSLSDKDSNGVPVIAAAFRIYLELRRQQAIIYPDGRRQQFEVPDTLVNIGVNQQGIEYYSVDWENFNSEHYLSLLASYATEYNNVGSAYISAMFGGNEQEQETSPSPLNAIAAYHLSKDDDAPRSLAGTRIDENTWIL